MPTGTIVRVCGAAPCAPKQSGSLPLSLSLALPPAFASAAVTWARADGIALAAGAVTAGGRSLMLLASELPSGGTPLTIMANISQEGVTGVASISVPINAAPYCTTASTAFAPESGNSTQGSCLALVAKSNVFPGAEFLADAPAFADDDDGAAALTYEWGTLDAKAQRVPQLTDRVTSFRFAALPLGATTVYVRAVDPLGASAEARAVVTVVDPPAGFDASTAVDALNITSLVNTADPSVINQAAASVAALASFSSASNASQEQKAAVQAAIDTKASALLLASSATVDSNDPDAAAAAAASAGAMVKVMANVSGEARTAVLNLGKNREWTGFKHMRVLKHMYPDLDIAPAAAKPAPRMPPPSPPQ